ncbi:MAG: prephenate dehydrogenase [Glomeribacter sp. 1016415]|nr:prephenate dehydrogenase [Glomeribacter sp. 1016415]
MYSDAPFSAVPSPSEALPASDFSFKKLVIVGVGLMGGSLARALRRAPAEARGTIVGVGRTLDSIARALQLGVIDQAVAWSDPMALSQALSGADLIVLAVPVAQTGGVLERIAPYLEAQALITDVGSTKLDVLAAAATALGDKINQFVPGHPIAGRELSGVEAALDTLYAQRNVVLCPQPENTESACERIAAMWRSVGAKIHIMTPAQHDQVLAAVSHLPHLLAFALIEQLLTMGNLKLKLALAGSGFQDFTRLAASNSEMWRDICLANRSALLAELDGYLTVVNNLRRALEESDGLAIQALFERARTIRTHWSLSKNETS